MELWLYAVELVCRSQGWSLDVPAMVLWRRLDPGERDDLEQAVRGARLRLVEELTEGA